MTSSCFITPDHLQILSKSNRLLSIGTESRKATEPHLEVLVQEVEEQQNGDQEGQGEGRCHPNQDDGRSQLQAAP